MLSGVYSGKLNELTMASTLPYLLDYKINMEVLLKALKRIKTVSISRKQKFVSFKGGLSTIIDRLEEMLTETVVKKGAVTTAVVNKVIAMQSLCKSRFNPR